MEEQLVSKKEPQNLMHLTLADFVTTVISFGDVADTTEIYITRIQKQKI